MVFAPTRSGKGVGLVVPTLLSWPHSVVVHDIKGEHWQLTAGWRSRFSHCLCFNPVDARSAAYNPLLEVRRGAQEVRDRSEEHTSELQSLMRISYAVFCLKKKINTISCSITQVEIYKETRTSAHTKTQ